MTPTGSIFQFYGALLLVAKESSLATNAFRHLLTLPPPIPPSMVVLEPKKSFFVDGALVG